MLFLIGQSDNIPGNVQTIEYSQEFVYWLLGVIGVIFLIFAIIYIIKAGRDNKKIQELKDLLKKQLTDEEIKLIEKYRELNSKSKNAVNETLNKEYYQTINNANNTDTENGGN